MPYISSAKLATQPEFDFFRFDPTEDNMSMSMTTPYCPRHFPTRTIPLSTTCKPNWAWLSHPLHYVEIRIAEDRVFNPNDASHWGRRVRCFSSEEQKVWPLKALARRRFNQYFRPLVKGPDLFYQLGLPNFIADYLLFKDDLDPAQAGHCAKTATRDHVGLVSIHQLVLEKQAGHLEPLEFN